MNPGERDVCALCGEKVPLLEGHYGPGDVIDGKFEVLSVLGVSSMSEVYAVRHEALDVLRCVKVIRKSLLADEVFKSDFLREARLATGVHHRNVALVHDIDVTDDGSYYIVWEFVDGLSVRHWSRRHGRWPCDLASLLAAQALDGLGHIHLKGLLHHNLTPDNLMVTVDFDGEPTVKITDLGVGRVVGGSSEASDAATQIGMYMGDPRYASPEQLGMLADQEAIDGRSDQYCLAVVLYEMIAGTPLFTSPTPQGYLVKHLTEPPPPFGTVAPDVTVPAGLQSVILRALQKNRDHRFGSAAELRRALEPWSDVADAERDRFAAMIEEDLPSKQKPREEPLERKTVAIESQALADRATRLVPLPETESESPSTSDVATVAGSTPVPTGEEPPEPVVDDKDVATIEDLERSGDLDQLNALGSKFTLGSPTSDLVQKAIDTVEMRLEEEREEADWKRAEEAGTSDEWARYLTAHPSSERANMALELGDESQAWEEVLAAGAIDQIDAFLERWPAGAHREKAIEARRDLERKVEEARIEWERAQEEEDWNRAEDEGTSTGWARYLEAHASSERAEPAEENRKECEQFERALDGGGLAEWDAYLDAWPEGRHREQAQQRRDDLERQLAEERERTEKERAEEAADWQHAERIGTAGAWNDYLDAHPESERREQAESRFAEAKEFEAAAETATLEGWDEFLKVWPEGVHYKRAVRERSTLEKKIERERRQQERAEEEADWKSATEEGTTEGWSAYIQAHPDSKRAERAYTHRDEAWAFETAVAANHLDDWNRFLDVWPRGAHRAEAIRRRDEIQTQLEEERLRQKQLEEEAAWNNAESEGSAAAWREYLEAHGDSDRALDARARRDEAEAWETAVDVDDLEAWSSFVASWPESPRRDEAARHRDELEVRIATDREEAEREQAVEEADWDRAMGRATSEAWDEYFSAHPSSERLDRAKEYRREAEDYQTAVATDDLESWRQFTTSWPDGVHATEAVARREVLERAYEDQQARLESDAWNRATNLGTASAWETYLASHGDSERSRLARRNHNEAVDYITAKMAGSGDDWKTFLDVWPDGPHAAVAIAALRESRQREADEKKRAEDEAWDEAMNAATSDGFTAFLERYPESDRVDDAQLLREQAADFSEARKADTPEQWSVFLEKFPEGLYADEARRSIALYREREEKAAYRRAVRQGTVEAFEEFIEAWPDSAYAEAARDAQAEALEFEKLSEGEASEQQWVEFVQRWPNGPHADEARKKLLDLREAHRIDAEAAAAEAAAPVIARRRSMLIAVVGLLVVALAVVGFFAMRSSAVWEMFHKAPTLSIDALPWAKVISVRDSSGRDVLPSGTRVTPVALALPKGDYKVVLAYGSPTAESRTVRVHVGDKGPVTVRENFAAVDPRAFFEESGW